MEIQYHDDIRTWLVSGPLKPRLVAILSACSSVTPLVMSTGSCSHVTIAAFVKAWINLKDEMGVLLGHLLNVHAALGAAHLATCKKSRF